MKWVLRTGAEDSEVLLIEGRKIVYRKDDAVLEATLLDNGEITPPVILGADPQLLDVHWAFRSR